ncbi:unnamed protein product [Dicrocoelium dendriticum]|nr:unnamed protein product [Dicrocoelium dendriticum]
MLFKILLHFDFRMCVQEEYLRELLKRIVLNSQEESSPQQEDCKIGDQSGSLRQKKRNGMALWSKPTCHPSE